MIVYRIKDVATNKYVQIGCNKDNDIYLSYKGAKTALGYANRHRRWKYGDGLIIVECEIIEKKRG